MDISMESQPQRSEFMNNRETLCLCHHKGRILLFS